MRSAPAHTAIGHVKLSSFYRDEFCLLNIHTSLMLAVFEPKDRKLKAFPNEHEAKLQIQTFCAIPAARVDTWLLCGTS